MRACAAFFMTPFEWREGEWRHASERYKTWSETAPYPKLIGDLYVYAREGAAALYRLDTQTGGVRTVPWPAAFASLRRRLEMPRPADPAGSRPMAPPVQWTVEEEIPALVLWVSERCRLLE